jgi:replication-associated recombination protein RarA
MTQQLFKNQYHPQTLDDYIGDVTTLQYYIERSLNGQEVDKGFILYGLPGTGKSTIVNVLVNHYEMDLFLTNSSDDKSL